MYSIKTIAVLGAGTMGNGIAQISAAAGYTVVMQDIFEESLEKGMAAINKSLNKMVSKGKMTQETADDTLSKISTTLSLEEAVKDADFVIEAVPEELELKLETYKRLNAACKKDCILGSNTSTLPITILASVVENPERVAGVHFMNPVPVIKGIELIRARHTSDECMDAILDYVKRIDREPVMAVDYAGFIVSRILDVYQNEAVKCVMDGNKPEDIDKAMKLCCNFPLGPCELMDLVGLDIVEHGLKTLENDFGEKYKAAPLLSQMVRAGEVGRKAGKGSITGSSLPSRKYKRLAILMPLSILKISARLRHAVSLPC